MIRVGLISDTHGLLRPQAMEFLRGSEAIVHAGDIGAAEILRALAELAPLTAVRGNNDGQPWAHALPETAWLRIGEVGIHVLHDLKQLKRAASATGARVVVSGHSHQPQVHERDGVWYVNPGSAGPRRFKLPVSVGELRIDGEHVTAHTVTLAV